MSEEKTKTKTKPIEAKKVDGREVIWAKVFAPFTEYFEGDAYSISAVNESGPFDILPKHHNFITMLLPCDLVIQTPEGEKKFRITRGLMHVRNNKIIVFLDV
jgi:F0F1-type ATP synthase epsilon subunit